MSDKYNVYIKIEKPGHTAEQITDAVGVSPQTVYRAGEQRKSGVHLLPGKYYEHDIWELSSADTIDPSKWFDDHLAYICGQLEKFKPTAKTYLEPGDLSIVIVSYENTTNPGVYIETGLVKLVADFNGVFDIDLYAVGPEDDEDKGWSEIEVSAIPETE